MLDRTFVRLIGAGLTGLAASHAPPPSSAAAAASAGSPTAEDAAALDALMADLVAAEPYLAKAAILAIVSEIWDGVCRSRIPRADVGIHIQRVADLLIQLHPPAAMVEEFRAEPKPSASLCDAAGLKLAASVLQRLRFGEAGTRSHELNEGVVFFVLHRLYAGLLAQDPQLVTTAQVLLLRRLSAASAEHAATAAA